MNPTIAIVGAGAVGGYYGARLALRGYDVHFLLRGDYDAVRRGGWRVWSCGGDFELPADRVRVYDLAERMPRADLVIVALKATHHAVYEPLIRPLLGPKTAILALQNGLGNEERLAGLFGAERVLGGIALVCINRVRPGVIHHIDHGAIRLGEFAGGQSERAEAIAEIFRSAGVECEVLDDLRRGRWEKLIWNIPFNGLGAVLNWTTDRLLATEEGRARVGRLMAEVMDAGRADGVTFRCSTEEMIERQLRLTATIGAYRTSMQIDRVEGRPMEVEAILGEPFRRGRAGGAETPLLQSVYELARLIDATRNIPTDRSIGTPGATSHP